MVLAEKVFGKDIWVLKGKITRPHPPVVTNEDIVEIPEELRIKDTEVALDMVYVEDQVFVNTVDWKLKYKLLACMGTKKKLADNEVPIEGIDEISYHYQRNNINVTWHHLYN